MTLEDYRDLIYADVSFKTEAEAKIILGYDAEQRRIYQTTD